MDALTVSAALGSLAAIGEYVLEAAAQAGLDRKASYRLRLAVDEIATNIVEHGYGEEGEPGEILVRADLREDSLAITLEDTAIPFDPTEIERAELSNLPLEQRPIGGLGLLLAIEGIDEFRYEHIGNRNRNVFIMRRTAAPERGRSQASSQFEEGT